MSTPRLYLLLVLLAVLPAVAQQPTTAPSAPSAPPEPQSQQAVDPETPLHVGGSVVPPTALYRVDPEFSEEARREKFSGTVRVYLWVEKDGTPSHVRIAQSAGHGLDEKAVEAVRQYRFNPATKNGEPVRVDLYIDISFQIYNKRHP
jgi:TonB family protein